ncbi:histidine phosphatase family protein [Leucobacter sp. OH2974_COT-288]|uniref:Broad specificity phosphatase PhoE n=1 Tax=Canibacter oris TaxID=1365628 RepID=A0A840DRK5_9MICO|nr:broad specificity phosphatase PhoE [Canibacter oris]RRD35428.1 histidine phosphatase family protein [Leucobacter sp. OH2974_COT-288]
MSEQTTRQIHLVRHGEVFNPDGVLYGRLPGFGLSENGHKMAALAAAELVDRGRLVGQLYASPLLRAQQSAAPLAQAFELPIHTEQRLLEPTNKFEGLRNHGPDSAFKQPQHWLKLWNPLLPSWGEPYARIARRITNFMDYAWSIAELDEVEGDIVMVSHQAVIWAAHRKIAGLPLVHNPARRRCDLSSITTFTRIDEQWQELGYSSPAAALIERSKDVGAV